MRLAESGLFHSLWRIPRSGDARALAKDEAARSGKSGSGGCYQALVEPGTTEKRLRRMRRIYGLLDCED